MPLREQLTAQIKLAILSQDLKPGQKLPSTREIARRFKIHSNTVSAAYRELSESGWVDMRAGSGIYVRRFKLENTIEAQSDLDNLIVECWWSRGVRGSRWPTFNRASGIG